MTWPLYFEWLLGDPLRCACGHYLEDHFDRRGCHFYYVCGCYKFQQEGPDL